MSEINLVVIYHNFLLKICLNIYFLNYRSALKDKGGKWTDKNLDKYLKSPADYAPGKFRLRYLENKYISKVT